MGTAVKEPSKSTGSHDVKIPSDEADSGSHDSQPLGMSVH